jgi:hypothetical protein
VVEDGDVHRPQVSRHPLGRNPNQVIEMSRPIYVLVLGAILAVLLSTCKKSDSITAPIDTPSATTTVSNISNAFDLTLTATSYTDTLTYPLSFQTDSLSRTLVVSGFGKGSVIIQILGQSSQLVCQDSVALDGVRTTYLKCVSTPGQLRVIARDFSGSLAFILRGIDIPVPPRTILGAWEWLYTSAGPWGDTRSPYSEGYTCQVYFMPDSSFAMFRNDSVLVCRGAYSLSEYSVAVTKTAFPFFTLRMAYYFKSANELWLWQDITAYDLPVSTFHRKTR